jgi:ADP-ribose pyrophosphatase YjhB (NUDIX family)
MMKVEKVCPVVIREKNGWCEILAFRHPLAGLQIVKGTVEDGEDLQNAARRELTEESGIVSISSCKSKGISDQITENQNWHFYHCTVDENLKETWEFFANEDGGINFSFFWFNLNEPLSNDWHPTFQRALDYIKTNF